MSVNSEKIGVIVVDHGSRRDESNRLLLDVVADLRAATNWEVLEAAHMELAEPSISDAFARCVEQGAKRIVVHPYFLGPGRHWKEDIPALAAEASQQHDGIPFDVTAPLGPHALLLEVITARVAETLSGKLDY